MHNEREDITPQQYVSELGGAAGLFLGVSLISVIKVFLPLINEFSSQFFQIMDHSVTILKREYYKRIREYQMRIKQISCQFIQTDVQD